MAFGQIRPVPRFHLLKGRRNWSGTLPGGSSSSTWNRRGADRFRGSIRTCQSQQRRGFLPVCLVPRFRFQVPPPLGGWNLEPEPSGDVPAVPPGTCWNRGTRRSQPLACPIFPHFMRYNGLARLGKVMRSRSLPCFQRRFHLEPLEPSCRIQSLTKPGWNAPTPAKARLASEHARLPDLYRGTLEPELADRFHLESGRLQGSTRTHQSQ